MTLAPTIDCLPPHLSERSRAVSGGEPTSGSYILYWMRTAARAAENPALDVCLELARQIDLPVFVYHALSERTPYASDRHHHFILQGARDVARQLRQRGIGTAFHLERPGQRGPYLLTLAQKAQLVVTEDMPVEPLLGWTNRLAEATSAPVWAVDTACLVPMNVVGREYTRAFAFRSATDRERLARLTTPWPEAPVAHPAFLPELPFAPVDLDSADFRALVASCDIDHSIGPVPDTEGGTQAGLERWRAFRDGKLKRYARDRNDPLRDGVSRLSPYLHYGFVSPFQIAREAAEIGGGGADKFLDELLVWRELAYAFCRFHPDAASWNAIPDWARQTLEEHSADRREAVLSWETLARARTGEPLWDAAQLSLLRHGELHNNVRMTWGKQLLRWTANPQRAFELAIDLNHRFALDGRDPASYGGILWCFGQFDRPFPPEQPVLGTTRPRPIENHTRRLDVPAYQRRNERTAGRDPGPIAILGAGIAGLACARILTDQGLRVTVFDKSRGTGGRMATRREGEVRFDLGAPFFTARTALFRRLTRSWIEDGLVAPITGSIVRIRGQEVDAASPEPRYRGVPGMSAITRHLTDGVSLRTGHRIASLRRTSEGWELEDDRGEELGVFPVVLVALPAEQAVPLLQGSKDLAKSAASIQTAPCLVRAMSFHEPIDVSFEAAFVEQDPDLAWLSRSQSGEHWVLHSTPELAERCFDDSPEEVTDRLLRAMARVTGKETDTPDFVHAHRWRYAKVLNPLDVGALFDEALGLGACGDWCRGARVEGGFQSGVALAGRVLGWCADGRAAVRQGTLFE